MYYDEIRGEEKMLGHYLRVQEAATLLGVAPPTVRWYSAQGWLPSYRIGRGQVAHRRFLYKDVENLAVQLGRSIPEEPIWDESVPVTREMAAQYLALSPRYLTEAGLVNPGQQFTWEQLQDLARQVYQQTEAGRTAEVDSRATMTPTGHKEESTMPGMGAGMHMHGSSRRGFVGGSGPWARQGFNGEGWNGEGWGFFSLDTTDLLALKAAKRHLEAHKADIEDRIAQIDSLIAAHPDNQQPPDL